MLFYIIVFSLLQISYSIGTLKHIQIFTRHGNRMPVRYLSFPNDPPLNMSTVPYSLGELTNEGINNIYMLGQRLNIRYGSMLLNDFIVSKHLSAVSGIDNRTSESTEALLAGMFIPGPSQIWNSFLPWKPIALTTTPILDEVGLGITTRCPHMMQTFDIKKIMNDLNGEFRDNITFISDLIGMKIDNATQLADIIENIATRYNLSFLPLSKASQTQEMRDEIANIHNRLQSGFIGKIIESSGGWHHGLIMTNIRNFIGNRTDHKMMLYGGHDTNIMTIANIYKIKDLAQNLAPYCSFLAIELHNINGIDQIQILFNNGSDPADTRLYNLSSTCGSPCTVEKFQNLYQEYSSSKWTSDCHGLNEAAESSMIFLTFSTILNFVFLACIMILSITCLNYRNLYLKNVLSDSTPLLLMR
uniref:Lysosomal acid phosphatase n=1 Tax=Rhabditophanes sp. KR3021 TaxID=114890 RepID=A0AC35TSY3_9BILA